MHVKSGRESLGTFPATCNAGQAHQTGHTTHGTPARHRLIALVTAGALLLDAPAAHAVACLPRDQIVANLANRYEESLAGRGLRGDANLYEIFMAEDGATWTILQSFSNGVSCVIASGDHWLVYEPVEQGGEEG